MMSKNGGANHKLSGFRGWEWSRDLAGVLRAKGLIQHSLGRRPRFGGEFGGSANGVCLGQDER